MPTLSSFGKRLWNSFRHLWEGTAPSSCRLERRQYPRFALALETPIELLSETASETVLAQVRNISHGGICLETKKAIEPGSLIHVNLPRKNEPTLLVLACVLHSLSQPPDTWTIGCSFLRELETEILDRLF